MPDSLPLSGVAAPAALAASTFPLAAASQPSARAAFSPSSWRSLTTSTRQDLVAARPSPQAAAQEYRIAGAGLAHTASKSQPALLRAFSAARAPGAGAYSRAFSTFSPLRNTPPPPAPPPSTGAAAGAAAAPLRPITFRNYPWRHLLIFPALHSSIAWSLLGPTYLFLSFTNLTPLLLTGPQGVAVLSTRIPSLVPDGALYGLRDARAIARKEGGRKGGGEVTVEEWAEASIRKAAGTTWRTAKGVRDLVNRFRGVTSVPGMLEQAAKDIGDEADGELAGAASGGKGRGQGWLAKARGLKNAWDKQGGGGGGDGGGETAIGNEVSGARGMVREYISKQTHSVTVRDLADVVGAWVLVKCLLPVRVPLSLWLTPKVVRWTLMRR